MNIIHLDLKFLLWRVDSPFQWSAASLIRGDTIWT